MESTAPALIKTAAQASTPPVRWSIGLRMAYRFACCYLILYILPNEGHVNLIDPIPGSSFLVKQYARLWHALVPWVAVHWLHVSGPAAVYTPNNGSGDTTLDYVQHLCYLAMAAAAALTWSVLDRRRPNYRRMHAWMHIAVRYNLAFTMFGYGFAKVIPMQFRPPTFGRLIEPLGDFSPMGLLWTFIGYSTVYQIFSGTAEVLGGTLLLFRRTATAGAMVSAAVLLNIFMMNMCYDVPVKLYSFNLLLMALFVMAGDLRRVANCLVLNRPSPPADLSGARFEERRLRTGVIVLQVAFIGFAVYGQVKSNWGYYSQLALHPARPPLYGLYDVEGFRLNGQEVAPLTTDTTRWKRVILQFPTNASVRMMDDSTRGFEAAYDTAQNRLTLTTPDKASSVFQYSKPDPNHVVLEGNLKQDALVVRLRKVDPQQYLLMKRGFHWINELYFNR
jgi:hypothetical protein